MTHFVLQRWIAHLALLGLDMIAVGLVELEAQPAQRTHIVARLTDDPMALGRWRIPACGCRHGAGGGLVSQRGIFPPIAMRRLSLGGNFPAR